MIIRERPSLRQAIELVDPDGRETYWTEDAPDPADAFQDLSYSSIAPGGFQSLDCRLARRIALRYDDMAPFATMRVRNASGGIDWEGRLERAARTSGRESSASPSAVGHQAALEDDKSVRALYIDNDYSRWIEATLRRKNALIASGLSTGLQWANSVDGDPDSTVNLLQSAGHLGSTAGAYHDIGEAWYDARGLPIYQLQYHFGTTGSGADTDWLNQAHLSSDDLGTSIDSGTDHNDGSAIWQTVTATLKDRKFALLQTAYAGTFTGDGPYEKRWQPTVIGWHRLTQRGLGFLASDIIGHQIATGFPLWRRAIYPTDLPLTQAAYLEPTTRADIIKDVNRFHTYDWFVWEAPTFVYEPRGFSGRRWRSRVGPAQLEETGPAADKMWKSVVVSWKDPDGSTKTVGPPLSGAQTIDSSLTNGETDIPDDRVYYLPLEVASPGTAINAGQRFLYEANQIDRSGKALQVGYVEDADTGVLEPASRIRAGDVIAFTDAADTSFRRISQPTWDRGSRTASLDLDSPAESLQAVLERVNAAVAPLGI